MLALTANHHLQLMCPWLRSASTKGSSAVAAKSLTLALRILKTSWLPILRRNFCINFKPIPTCRSHSDGTHMATSLLVVLKPKGVLRRLTANSQVPLLIKGMNELLLSLDHLYSSQKPGMALTCSARSAQSSRTTEVRAGEVSSYSI